VSASVDRLCRELLDLARAQQAALVAGNADEALAIFDERRRIQNEIQKIDGPAAVAPQQHRSAVEEILAVDRNTASLARLRMADIASRLDGIDKLKRYFRTVAPSGGHRGGVTA
jgi:hypothetical protein